MSKLSLLNEVEYMSEDCSKKISAPKQTKSKQRIMDHGEVFTAEREVKAMLDMVISESDRIDSRFLEPACGDGNFLVEVLNRKLETVAKSYKSYPPDFEKYSILAVSSIYGVDILQDNVTACQERLYEIWNNYYKKYCKKEDNNQCRDVAKYILSKNILCGNALDMLRTDGSPIIFAQWDLIGSKLKRRDYRLDELISGGGNNISMTDDSLSEWEYDKESKTMMPKPIREYTPVDYRRISENE